jgi:muramoyltetrapeptide carboxypeptidase
MKTLKPPALRKGDKIGIISPSEPIVYRKKFGRGVEALKKIGFKVVLAKGVFEKRGAYLAGRRERRAEQLNSMFKNPEINGIFCSRGGFSSSHLLNLLNFETIKKNPKIFMGFSDITVLINAIYAKTGLVAFHGQNVEHGFSYGFSGKYKYSLEYFEKAVMKNEPIGPIRKRSKIAVLKNGKAKGKLVGGNLACLMTLLGTEYEPDWNGKILFWEEFYQTSQEIDFYLTHLRLSKVFDKISGMVIGKLVGCDILRYEDDWKKGKAFPINKIILNVCRDYKFPIIKGFDFGHVYPQITIPIGVKATIDTSKKLFSIDETAVNPPTHA